MSRLSIALCGIAVVACGAAYGAASADAQNLTDLRQFSTFACQFTAKSVRVLSAQDTVDEPGDPLTVYALVNYKDHTAVMSEASSGYVPVTAMVGPGALHLVSADANENLISVTLFARTAAKADGPN